MCRRRSRAGRGGRPRRRRRVPDSGPRHSNPPPPPIRRWAGPRAPKPAGAQGPRSRMPAARLPLPGQTTGPMARRTRARATGPRQPPETCPEANVGTRRNHNIAASLVGTETLPSILCCRDSASHRCRRRRGLRRAAPRTARGAQRERFPGAWASGILHLGSRAGASSGGQKARHLGDQGFGA